MTGPPADPSQQPAAEPGLRRDPVLRRVLANTAWLLGGRGVQVPLALLESVLVARLLGAEAYGILGVVMSFVAVVHKLTSFRMHEVVVKYMADDLARHRPRAAAATLKAGALAESATTTLAFVIALAAAPLAARTFVHSPQATALIWGYAAILLCEAVTGSSRAALQVLNRFAVQATAGVVRKLVLLALVGCAFLLDSPLAGVVAAYVVAGLVAAVYQGLRAHREAQRALGRDWLSTPLAELRGRAREMARFALSTNLSATLSLIVRDSDLLWISFFRPPVEAGYYKLALGLLKAPFAAGSPMTSAVYPELARSLARRAWAETRSLLRRTTLIAAAWILPVSVAAAILAPWLVRQLYGAEYLPAAAAFRLLLVGIAAANLVFWTRSTLLALGRPDAPLKIAGLNTVLKVALALVLVPAFGYLGAAGLLSGLYCLGLTLSLLVIASEFRRRDGDPTLRPQSTG